MANDTILSCPICNYPKIRDCGNGLYRCDFCETYFDKDENIVPTWQEWLQTADVEQLAEFLWQYTHDLITDWERINDPMFRFLHMPLKNILGDNCTKKEAWVEWLKQPHREE